MQAISALYFLELSCIIHCLIMLLREGDHNSTVVCRCRRIYWFVRQIPDYAAVQGLRAGIPARDAYIKCCGWVPHWLYNRNTAEYKSHIRAHEDISDYRMLGRSKYIFHIQSGNCGVVHCRKISGLCTKYPAKSGALYHRSCAGFLGGEDCLSKELVLCVI